MRSFLVLALLALALAGCQKTQSDATSATPTAGAPTGMSGAATTTPPSAATTKEVTMPTGLKYEDVVVGTGAEAQKGKRVSVHYTGRLQDGTKFDSSLDRGEPYTFVLGSGSVIQGWDEGLVGMKVGGKRKLTIPPSMGYGPSGMGPIPPNATLLFDCELMDVQ